MCYKLIDLVLEINLPVNMNNLCHMVNFYQERLGRRNHDI